MKKDCCDVRITETDKGFRIEVEGEDVKDKCRSFFEGCEEKIKNCCSTEETKKSCCC